MLSKILIIPPTIIPIIIKKRIIKGRENKMTNTKINGIKVTKIINPILIVEAIIMTQIRAKVIIYN
jgi:hypothetical protein